MARKLPPPGGIQPFSKSNILADTIIDMGYVHSMAPKAEQGFTLVELLLIIAMIGLLAAIALPLLEGYRQRSYDSQAVSDLKQAALAEEAYFTQNSNYTDCIGTITCEGTLPNFKASAGTNVSMFQVPQAGNTPQYFTGQSWHPKGTRNTVGTAFMWNSNSGGLQ